MTTSPIHPAGRLRILVVDDHPAVRAGLSLLLASTGMTVSDEAAGLGDALACAQASRPDAAVVDLILEGESGLAVTAALAERNVPVLVYSMHGDGEHVRRALEAGALGYVTKAEAHGVLTDGLREVAAGHRYLSPRAALALADQVTEAPRSNPVQALSGKEREVFLRLGEGDGTLEIARAMQISVHTVESYYTRIQLKLGVQGMYGLRHCAIEHARRRPT
jgi:DNA-binding NarL/FixJ family response regulator